jgi:hypothetical protein
MTRGLGFWAVAILGAAPLACSSEALTSDGGAGSGNSGTAGSMHMSSGCSAALKQQLALVDEVSTAAVTILDESANERSLYVDASAGGIDGAQKHPWVYLSLKTGRAVPLTDLEALDSTDWDLAFKRTMVRTNSGDSGPGVGGAIRVGLAWDKVSRTTLGGQTLPIEDWFDDMCMIGLDSTNNVITSFSSWSEYDPATHIVNAAPDVVYITGAADGTLYKVQIEDYYSTPTGGHGTDPGKYAGHYRLRTAPLP